MDIAQYIQMRINDSVKNGVIHLKKEFEERYSSYDDVTIADLESWVQDVHRKMQEAESFTVDHTYYWSLHCHLEDIVKHVKLL